MIKARHISPLHVRVTALFLGLLVLLGGVYYWWMQRTVFAPPVQDAATDHWFAELVDAEIDSLARTAVGADADALAALLDDYGRAIAPFDAEAVFFDAATGAVLAATGADSLAAAVGEVDPALLADMAAPGWDFDTIYPDPTDIDAYVNRIIHVAAVDGDGAQPAAYLAASYRVMVFSAEDVAIDPRRLWLQAVLVGLAGSFVAGWLLMAWLTRRIRLLSATVSRLAEGRLDARAPTAGGDELGQLGRDVNVMAARLEATIEELKGKEQFQRQLIANISHDLRTPMASLRGYVETLGLGADKLGPEKREAYLGVITENIDHLDRLIDHLLQLSRLDDGQAAFQREVFPAMELVESVLARCEPQARAKSIALRCRCGDDVPLVEADPLQIGQVLQNLVDNAIKFGREEGLVEVSLRPVEGGAVEVAVRDDGPGIAAEDQPRIFERFFTGDRSRSRTGKIRSSGLGLAISARIVEAHGGELTVESQPGHGACFRFRLQGADERREMAAES